MAIGNIPARKRGFGYDPVTRSLGIYTDGQLTASFPPTPGRTYFVNNITGSATNDGLSWATAMDEVSTAITASEAYRELGGVESGAAVTTNDYVRNTIMVQGTETAYTGLSDLGEECNLVGLASPTGGRGWMASSTCGGVQIGNATRAGLEGSTGSFTGDYISNIQFLSRDATSIFETATLDQSCLEDVGFYVASVATSQPENAFSITTGCNGTVLRRCHVGNNAQLTSRPKDGLHISGTIFRNSLVEYCMFCGSEKAFHIPSTCTYADGTMVWHNFMGNFGHGSCDYGIYDACASGVSTGGHITYVNNFIDADDAMSITSDFSRCIDNHNVAGLVTD